MNPLFNGSILACVAMVTACSKPLPEPKEPTDIFMIRYKEAFPDAQQHTAISSVIAGYYCTQNNQWPASVADIRKYLKEFKINTSPRINWDTFSSPDVTYVIGKNLIITTPGSPQSPYRVTTTHMPPNCSQNPVQAHLALEVEKTVAK